MLKFASYIPSYSTVLHNNKNHSAGERDTVLHDFFTYELSLQELFKLYEERSTDYRIVPTTKYAVACIPAEGAVDAFL